MKRNEYGYRENFDLVINSDDKSRLDKIFESGYGLNRFVCGSYLAKVCAVKQGYGLDMLVDDESCFVREAVAKRGYGLDKLIND